MQHKIESVVGRSFANSAIRSVQAVLSSQDRTIALFGLDVTDTTIERAAGWIVERARHAIPTQVSFLNADCVNIMHHNPAYREALEQSGRIFADGIGVRLAARLAGHKLQDNVNGTDLFPVLCRHAVEAQLGIFLFGARDGRARAAGENMQRANPSLTIAGSHHGYIHDATAEARVIDAINASGAEILLVALGAPDQELWIARNRSYARPSCSVSGACSTITLAALRALQRRYARSAWSGPGGLPWNRNGWLGVTSSAMSSSWCALV